MLARLQKLGLVLALFWIQGCGDTWNNPYPPKDGSENTLYTSFSERPKHLDPAVSYSAEEAIITYQVYEQPLQYDYLKRPYELSPLIAKEMPTVKYLDKAGKEVSQTDPNAVLTVYTIKIQEGIMYQKHPAFAKKPGTDELLYDNITHIDNIHTLNDFKETGTRELVAEDFVYEIKRIADPTINSPIYGLMVNYIVGYKDFSEQLKKIYQAKGHVPGEIPFVDLREIPMQGVKVIDKYTYEIQIQGGYPQFIYWLAMPFFAPMPWEACKFYAQPILTKRNISLDWYPVGTGPYLLKENNPNLRMVLEKNPLFRLERYPTQGTPEDIAQGLLVNAGKPIPFLDQIIFVLEKESIPYWTKFLQGYYDQSGVSSDVFDQAFKFAAGGSIELNDELKDKGIRMSQAVQPSIFYWGFNMLDPMVGGSSEKTRKLRQAISIAMDVEEYINIFLNGRATAAQSPLAPGIFGYREDNKGINPVVYQIDPATGKSERKSIEIAKQLLAQAGYKNGIDPKTQQPLILYYDVPATSNPDAQSQLTWIRKQFKKLGIELIVRATQYNRFQDKVANGDFQIFLWGWNADYPDPENFLFLLYGKNARVKFGGENASNYSNPEFDTLFEKMKSMPNSSERQKVIDEMVNIVQQDAPWVFGFNPVAFILRQQWVEPFKPNAMSRNTIKYMSIEPPLRAKYRKLWNQPITWPLLVGLSLLILLCIPAVVTYWRKMHRPMKLRNE